MQVTQVTVEEKNDSPGAWTVEAIGQDGEIYQAIFAGPEAQQRACGFSRTEYPVILADETVEHTAQMTNGQTNPCRLNKAEIRMECLRLAADRGGSGSDIIKTASDFAQFVFDEYFLDEHEPQTALPKAA